jgi:lincosamide nucleotidyltransferase A/C/D/E
MAPEVANTVMLDATDRLIVCVDSRLLEPHLRYEATEPGTYEWPHLYAPLPVHAVLLVTPYERRADGRFGGLPEAVRNLDAGPDRDGPMTVDSAHRVLAKLDGAALWHAVAGGWGIDALLGRQTRPHGDLDLAVDASCVDAVLAALQDIGFAVRADQRPTRIDVARADGASIDLHPVHFNADGNGRQLLDDGSHYPYPPDGFTEGVIGGRTVRCLGIDLQISFHRGYEPGDNSYRDMHVLCRAFGRTLPPPYVS